MSTLGYVVITYNQASGQPHVASGDSLYDTPDEAGDYCDYLREETAKVGRGERHEVAEVALFDEEDW